MSRGLRVRVLVCASACAPAVAAAQGRAASCDTSRARVAPDGAQGLRINSVDVRVEGPTGARGLKLLQRMHHDTRPARVRQELSFQAGDALDTALVAQSMRRLRALGFLDDAELEVRRCAGEPGVDLVVVTRDAWSATPEVRLRASTATLGLSERNVLGSGVAARLALQSGTAGLGVTAAMRLPGLPVRGLTSELGAVSFRNGSTYYGSLTTRAPSSAPAWTFDARMASSEREPRDAPGSVFDRATSSLLVGRRLGGVDASALYLLLGAESDRADVAAKVNDVVLGPRAVRRAYAGANAGMARVATRADTAGWLFPGGGIADVPRGLEGEGVVGIGRDRLTGALAGRWDGWVGRALTSSRSGTLVVADAWASGFVGDDLLRSSRMRGAITARRVAWRGGWALRAAAERLTNPDPDVRALATLDVLTAALPRTTRLAEAAVAASVERSVHLHALTRSVGLDGALFAAGDFRWKPAGTAADELGLGALGLGLRLAPARSPRATVRLDVGVPVLRTSSVRGRPYVAITIVPWALDGRRRDGRALP